MEQKHSIKDDVKVSCPSCNATMVKVIDGGSAVLTAAPRRFHQQIASLKKNREDMQHANRIKNWIKNEAQPKSRASLGEGMKRMSDFRKSGADVNDPVVSKTIKSQRETAE